MPNTLNLLALDFGASNGRGILGAFDGERVELSELYRFENQYIRLRGRYYWDIMHLYASAVSCFEAAARSGIQPSAFGIDTWGVDYGLLDKNGGLISQVRSYRDMSDDDMPPVWDTISKRVLFDHTGIAHLCFNTIYQLHRRKREGDAGLESAKTLLFLPDLLAFICTEAFCVMMRACARGSDGLAEVSEDDLLEIPVPELSNAQRSSLEPFVDRMLLGEQSIDDKISQLMASGSLEIPIPQKRPSHVVLV